MAKRSALKEVIIDGKKPKPMKKGESIQKSLKKLSVLRSNSLGRLMLKTPS